MESIKQKLKNNLLIEELSSEEQKILSDLYGLNDTYTETTLEDILEEKKNKYDILINTNPQSPLVHPNRIIVLDDKYYDIESIYTEIFINDNPIGFDDSTLKMVESDYEKYKFLKKNYVYESPLDTREVLTQLSHYIGDSHIRNLNDTELQEFISTSGAKNAVELIHSDDVKKKWKKFKANKLKQKLKKLLSDTGDCETVIDSLESWELDVLAEIYGTNSKNKLCSILVRTIPNELIREVFMHSDSKDIVSWENSEFMDKTTFMRKKDSNIRDAARKGNLLGVKYLASESSAQEKNNALRWAATSGHLEVVKYLHEAGADVHALEEYALRTAASKGHLEIVKYLHEAGADIHIRDEEALKLAAEHGHLEVVEYLVTAGADIHNDDDWALREAAQGGHLKIVKYLIAAGAVIPDGASSSADDPDVAKYLREIESTRT